MRDIVTDLATESDREARLRLLHENAPTILNYLYYEQGPIAEMRRFAQLVHDARLRRLTSLLNAQHFFSNDAERNNKLRNAFVLPNSLNDQIEESRLKINWLKRIWSVNPKKAKNTGRADATALARLELINRRAHRLNAKVVLVSGDRGMFEIAEGYRPYGPRGDTFATLYLRHPRAFVTTPDVLTPAEQVTTASSHGAPRLIVEWLDALLARYTTDEGIVGDKLRALINDKSGVRELALREAKSALKLDPHASANIRDQWRGHVRRLEGAHSVTSKLARPELLAILDGVNKRAVEEGIEGLGRELALQTEQTWEIFLSAVVRAGFDLTLVEANPPMGRRRNAPPIVFERSKEASRFCRMVLAAHSVSSLVPTAFRENIAALNKEEPTGYAELVAYGVVFGHAGKWHVAALLAARAISIAENIQRSRKRGDHPIASTKISGREAYYLRAGCLRFKARSEQDLAGIEQLLENADRAYMSDRAGNPGLPDTSYRFAAERLSLRLNRCLMKLLSPEGNNSRDIEEACLIVSDLDVMAQRLKEAQVSWVQRIVERNVLTNIYMMHAAVELVAGKSSQEIEKVGKRHIAAFLENLALDEKLKDGGFPKTWLVSAVSWHAIGRFGEPDRKTRASFRDEIGRLEHLLREEPDTLIVAPYDKRRFEILATLGKRHFGVS